MPINSTAIHKSISFILLAVFMSRFFIFFVDGSILSIGSLVDRTFVCLGLFKNFQGGLDSCCRSQILRILKYIVFPILSCKFYSFKFWRVQQDSEYYK